jgi:anti-sigma B factor antagonist
MAGILINTRRASDGSVLIDVRGDVDIEGSARLRHLLVETVTRTRPGRIVVDLLHVTFIDSTGIGALAAGRNAAHQVGVGFTLRHPSGFVAQQLRQTGLYDTLVNDR